MSVHGFPIITGGKGSGGSSGGKPSKGVEDEVNTSDGAGGWKDALSKILTINDELLFLANGKSGYFSNGTNEIKLHYTTQYGANRAGASNTKALLVSQSTEPANYRASLVSCQKELFYAESVNEPQNNHKFLRGIFSADLSGSVISSEQQGSTAERGFSSGTFLGQRVVLYARNYETDPEDVHEKTISIFERSINLLSKRTFPSGIIAESDIDIKSDMVTFGFGSGRQLIMNKDSFELRMAGDKTFHFDSAKVLTNVKIEHSPSVNDNESILQGQVKALIAAIPSGGGFFTFTLGRYSLSGVAAVTGIGVPMTGDGTINAPKGFSPLQTFDASTVQTVKGHHVCNYGSTVQIEVELRFTASIGSGGLSPTAGTLAGSAQFMTSTNGSGNKFTINSTANIPAGSYVWIAVRDSTNSFSQTVVSATIKLS